MKINEISLKNYENIGESNQIFISYNWAIWTYSKGNTVRLRSDSVRLKHAIFYCQGRSGIITGGCWFLGKLAHMYPATKESNSKGYLKLAMVKGRSLISIGSMKILMQSWQGLARWAFRNSGSISRHVSFRVILCVISFQLSNYLIFLCVNYVISKGVTLLVFVLAGLGSHPDRPP